MTESARHINRELLKNKLQNHIKRFFIISQHSLPEPPPIAYLMDEIACYMAKRGHEVHLLTGFPSYPKSNLYRGFKRDLALSQVINGIHIHRFWSSIYGERFIKRMLFFMTWSYSLRIFGRKLPRPDLLYLVIPPPSAAVSAIHLARYFECPIVVHIQDMHPDSAIAAGFVRNTFLIKYLTNQEQWIYSNVDKILTIGKGFYRSLLAKGVPAQKISICPNWINVDEIKPRAKYPNPVRDRFAISQEKRIVLYAGTLGRSHGTSILLDAAKLLQDVHNNILFVFVGRGHERNELEERIRSEKIKNALLYDPVDRKDLADMLSMADLAVVSLRPGFSDLSVPSKVLGYMAVGRPVLALVDVMSDTAEIIKEAGCGEIIKPNDPIALADAIIKWLNNYELCKSAGEEGRRYSEKHLHPNILLDKLASELEMIL